MNALEAQGRIFKALDQLAEQLEESSDALETFLMTMGRFHRYSFWNSLLIQIQKPEATHVAGFNTWKTLDRHVRAGSKAIYILAPILTKQKTDSGDKEQLHGFKTAHVFDISQTDGKPLPQLGVVKGRPGFALKKLHDYAKKLGITIKMSDGIRTAQGVSLGGTILLKAGMSQAEEFGTLVHELCHEKLHTQDERATLPKQVLEVEAEAVSFVVCSTVGLDTNSASADYIKCWKGNPKLLRASLDRIQKVSSAILEAIL